MKNMSKWALGLVAATAPLLAAGAARADTIASYNFEDPVVNGYAYTSATPGAPSDHTQVLTSSFLIYGANGGIAANGSAFGVVGADGIQAGFLQGPGSISTEALSFDPGEYSVSFLDEGRANYGSNPFDVSFVGTNGTFGTFDVGQFTPTSTSSFNTVTTGSTLLSGTYQLVFKGTTPADVTSFIDDIRITSTPLPKSACAGAGLMGLVGLATLRRKSAVA